MACQTFQIPNVKAPLINVIMILVIGVYNLPIECINNSTIIVPCINAYVRYYSNFLPYDMRDFSTFSHHTKNRTS